MRLAAAALSIVLGGCGLLDDVGGSTGGTEPPPEALPADWPPEIADRFPKDPEGRPIVGSISDLGVRLDVAYDQTLDDPTARWGECLERVVACYRVNPGRPIADCIAQVEPCADDAGGHACCAPACLAAFDERLQATGSEDRAVDESFVAGDCLVGFGERVEP